MSPSSVYRQHPVLLQGPTSAGKTSLIQYLARATGHKCVRINNHEHTDLQEYVGMYTASSKGQLIFQEGMMCYYLVCLLSNKYCGSGQFRLIFLFRSFYGVKFFMVFVVLFFCKWFVGSKVNCNMDSVLEGTMNVEFMSPDATLTSTLVNSSCDGEPTRMCMLLWLS